MKPTREGVKITIAGRDFSIACPAEEEDNLQEAARYLDKNMQEIQKTGKIIGADRCAIMAALNITNELLDLKRKTAGNTDIEQRLQAMQEKIDHAVENIF